MFSWLLISSNDVAWQRVHLSPLKQISAFHYQFQTLLISSSFFTPSHLFLIASLLLFYPSLSCLSFLCAAVAGCPGIWGPGGGSGVQGPRKSSSAGQMVPPGGGDYGLPRFSYSPEKWGILLSGHEAHSIWIIFVFLVLAPNWQLFLFFSSTVYQSLDLQLSQVCHFCSSSVIVWLSQLQHHFHVPNRSEWLNFVIGY